MSLYETLLNVQSGDSVYLQRPIDNRAGNLDVALRSMTWKVGWYNLKTAIWFSWAPDGGGVGVLDIPAGLYNVQTMIDLILATEAGTGFNLVMSVSNETGLLSFTSNQMEISASDPLWTLFGLDAGLGGTWLRDTQEGNRPVDFSGVDRIFVHLTELNTYQNSVGGAPSTLLDIITPSPAKFGDIREVFRPLPFYKRVSDGVVSTLRVRLLDSGGKEIDNHGFMVTCVLEFRQQSQ